MRKSLVRKIILWIFLLTWMSVIFVLSNQSGSESTTVSEGVLSFVTRFIPFGVGHVLLRKSAHFLEYMFLGILVFLVIREYKRIDKKQFVFSILFCMVYACSDELHQLFIIGRSAQVFDILIDTVGSISGIITIYFLLNSCHKE